MLDISQSFKQQSDSIELFFSSAIQKSKLDHNAMNFVYMLAIVYVSTFVFGFVLLVMLVYLQRRENHFLKRSLKLGILLECLLVLSLCLVGLFLLVEETILSSLCIFLARLFTTQDVSLLFANEGLDTSWPTLQLLHKCFGSSASNNVSIILQDT